MDYDDAMDIELNQARDEGRIEVLEEIEKKCMEALSEVVAANSFTMGRDDFANEVLAFVRALKRDT